MYTYNENKMKMSALSEKILLSKAKIVWKTLVVLALSVLLFAPTPALALDYDGTLQTYISNTKIEIDGVLTSIKKLPSQSYENGKTTLAEIDRNLQTIQTNAGKNAQNFQKLSDRAQKEYEQVLAQIKDAKPSAELILSAFLNYIKNGRKPGLGFLNDREIPSQSKEFLTRKMQNLSEGIVLTNKISKLSDDLEKRVNLAKQKSGNVKEYADALQSFNDSDIISEIAELDRLVANLTNNLTLGS